MYFLEWCDTNMMWYEMVWHALLLCIHMWSIKRISLIKSAMSLHMLRQYDIKFTIWSCHYSFQVQSTTHLTGKRVKIYKWHSTVAYCSAVCWNNLRQSNMRCAQNMAGKNKLQKLRTHQAEWHKVVLPYSDSLWYFFSWWVRTNNTLTAPMPAWKNMPMMAIIASLPFAISALSFLVFSAGSAAVNTLNPKSPAYASVPGVCSWETSQKAM